MGKKSENTYYLVHYRDPRDGAHQSLKARKISDSSLGLSFISLSDFIFDTNSLLVNPDEEAKKANFENVKTFHLSIYSVLSISEIGEHTKDLSFKNDRSNLFVLNGDPHERPPN